MEDAAPGPRGILLLLSPAAPPGSAAAERMPGSAFASVRCLSTHKRWGLPQKHETGGLGAAGGERGAVAQAGNGPCALPAGTSPVPPPRLLCSSQPAGCCERSANFSDTVVISQLIWCSAEQTASLMSYLPSKLPFWLPLPGGHGQGQTLQCLCSEAAGKGSEAAAATGAPAASPSAPQPRRGACSAAFPLPDPAVGSGVRARPAARCRVRREMEGGWEAPRLLRAALGKQTDAACSPEAAQGQRSPPESGIEGIKGIRVGAVC